MYSSSQNHTSRGLEEIGEGAFCYAIDLEDVNFPSSLKAIRRRCFSDCISLNVNPLVIPEGVEEIGYMAFVNCKSLTGKVVLPTTLKRINDGAFFSTKITECNFPMDWKKSATVPFMLLV